MYNCISHGKNHAKRFTNSALSAITARLLNMCFQAYRSVYAPITIPNKIINVRAVQRFIFKHPQYRVPCAQIRTDFSRAFEDVKLAQEKGYFAAVLCLEGER